MKQYLEITLTFDAEHTELVEYELYEQGALGIQELEGKRIVYCPAGEDWDEKIRALAKSLPQAQLHLERLEVKEEENWQDNWKEHFKPLEIGRKMLVRPPWEAAWPGKVEVVINPGMGFGTGYHETTRLALEALEDVYQNACPASVIDVGAGSGILTIAAVKLGAVQAWALEIEAEALAEIPQNFALSGLDASLCECILGGPELLAQTAPLVVANITGDVLLELSDDLERLTTDHLLLSGIMPEYVEPLLKRFGKHFQLIEKSHLKEWNALHFRKRT